MLHLQATKEMLSQWWDTKVTINLNVLSVQAVAPSGCGVCFDGPGHVNLFFYVAVLSLTGSSGHFHLHLLPHRQSLSFQVHNDINLFHCGGSHRGEKLCFCLTAHAYFQIYKFPLNGEWHRLQSHVWLVLLSL